MTSLQQREQLQSQIWKIANEVRGAVDGWDFKQFVLGTLFYRFISENFTDYIEGGDDSIDYASLPDSIITPEIKEDAVKTKGYFIYPSQLFVNVVKTANTNPNLNTDLKAIFDSTESSAKGYASEKNIKGLFADFDTTSTRLGNTVENKNSRLAAVSQRLFAYTIYLLLRYFNQSFCLSEIKILLIISNKDSYVKSIKVVLPQSVSNDLYSGIACSKKCLLPCG